MKSVYKMAFVSTKNSCKTARSGLQNGTYCVAKRAVRESKTGRFAIDSHEKANERRRFVNVVYPEFAFRLYLYNNSNVKILSIIFTPTAI